MGAAGLARSTHGDEPGHGCGLAARFRAAMRLPICWGMLWRTPSSRSRRSPPADFIAPAQPTLVAKPPAGPEWLHEVKHDGYRLIARKQGGCVVLWSRHGTVFTDKLPRIAAAVRVLPADDVVLDGEAVVLRHDGHSDFSALRAKYGAAEATLIAFDLLHMDGEDRRRLPLEVRGAEVEALVAGCDGILFSEAIAAEGSSSSPRCARWAWKEFSRSASAGRTGAGAAGTG